MLRRRFGALVVGFLIALAAPARADESPIGFWSGRVSWSERPIVYTWEINADGTFTSGREGRGHDGGGVWRVRGVQLTLKYPDGFRYEGEIWDNQYSGTAYRADGELFGSFAMSRVEEAQADESPD